MNTTLYDIAERFVGLKEIPGRDHRPQILAMLQLDASWPKTDEVPWCAGFVNYCAWLLRLPRSKSLLARSWLGVGRAVELGDARVGYDVVVLKRGTGNQPGPSNHTAPGHVGLFAGVEGGYIHILGGNQSNAVNVQRYPARRLLGVRRLHG